MSRTVVVVTSRMPPGVRGALTQWYVEVAPGVFVGSPSERIRDALWQIVTTSEAAADAYALEVLSKKGDTGFVARTHGDYPYEIVDFDGIQLVTRHHRKTPAGSLDGLPDPTW